MLSRGKRHISGLQNLLDLDINTLLFIYNSQIWLKNSASVHQNTEYIIDNRETLCPLYAIKGWLKQNQQNWTMLNFFNLGSITITLGLPSLKLNSGIRMLKLNTKWINITPTLLKMLQFLPDFDLFHEHKLLSYFSPLNTFSIPMHVTGGFR